MPDWVTTLEAADLTGYHPEHLRELIREGKIVAEKKGAMWWVDRKSLLAYLKTAEKVTDKRHGPRSRRTRQAML